MLPGIQCSQNAADVDFLSSFLRNIVTKEPDFSGTLSARAKAFIKALLVKDPGMRLGAQGADDIKAHPFFEGVVWDHVMRKACLAPIVPTIRHELDVSNFDEEVTSMAVTEPMLVQSGWKGIRMFPVWHWKIH